MTSSPRALMRATPALFLGLSVSVSSLTFSPAQAATLDELLAKAADQDPAIASSTAQADASAAQVGQARASLLPRLSASAGYTRNEVATEVTLPGSDPITITPLDELSASARLDVPLVDASGWATLAAANDCRDAAAAQATASTQSALLAVVQAAWDLRSATLARDAAAAAVTAQTRLLDRASARHDAGTGSNLDRLRATADLARARGALADAEADLSAARRALAARTGVSDVGADLVPRPLPDGDLDAAHRPEVDAARATLDCRTRTRSAHTLGLAPTLGAFAQERVTNATGFSGQAATWSAGASLTWTPVDGGRRGAQVAQADADVRAAEAALAQREQEAADALADARARLDAAALSREAAATREVAATAAATDAQARFEAGTGSAVDLSLALRDALDATVEHARAEARYAVAVETLRLAAGRPLLEAR